MGGRGHAVLDNYCFGHFLPQESNYNITSGLRQTFPFKTAITSSTPSQLRPPRPRVKVRLFQSRNGGDAFTDCCSSPVAADISDFPLPPPILRFPIAAIHHAILTGHSHDSRRFGLFCGRVVSTNRSRNYVLACGISSTLNPRSRFLQLNITEVRSAILFAPCGQWQTPERRRPVW